jgi:hypothetical protein
VRPDRQSRKRTATFPEHGDRPGGEEQWGWHSRAAAAENALARLGRSQSLNLLCSRLPDHYEVTEGLVLFPLTAWHRADYLVEATAS